MKGVYATIHHFIRCQDDPAAPKGTVVVVNSMACGVIVPGVSGYSTSKYVAQRLIEYLDSGELAPSPQLRCWHTN